MSTVTFKVYVFDYSHMQYFACDEYNEILLLHVGSIIAGMVSDVLRARAVTSVASLAFAIPSVSAHAFTITVQLFVLVYVDFHYYSFSCSHSHSSYS